jgi:hypothetical protein
MRLLRSVTTIGEQVTDHTRRTWAASGRDPDLALEAS